MLAAFPSAAQRTETTIKQHKDAILQGTIYDKTTQWRINPATMGTVLRDQ